MSTPGDDKTTVELPGSGSAQPEGTPSTRDRDGPAAMDSPFASGRRFGRYVLIAQIGQGGMGVVWSAYDPQLDRKLALKFLVTPEAIELRARLLQEAKSVARIVHSNVVAVFDAGMIDGQAFIAMELIEGQTLLRWVEEKQPSWREVVAVYFQAGQGLAAAHAQGIVHRDFKPSNVLIDSRGRPHIIDFGIAALSQPVDTAAPTDESRPARGAGSGGQLHLTDPGFAIGTPPFMSPEQHSAGDASPHSDQFNFAAAFYHSLYGQFPFSGKSAAEILESKLQGKLRSPPPSMRVPKWLNRIVVKGLAVDPKDRWSDLNQMLAVLRDVPTRRRRRVMLGAAVLLLAVGGFGTVAYRYATDEGRRCPRRADEIVTFWNGQRRDQVRGGFSASGVTDWQGTFRRVMTQADRYVRQLRRGYVDACEATYLRGTESTEAFELRVLCLRERIRELEMLSDIFARADPELMGDAVEAVSGLVSVSRCENTKALLRDSATTASPEDQEGVENLRRELARVRVLNLAGQYEAALELAEAIHSEAFSLGFLPIEAEAEYWLGKSRENASQYASAVESLRNGFFLGLQSGHDRVAIMAAIDLMFITGYRSPEKKQWPIWEGVAKSMIARGAGDELNLADMASKLGLVFMLDAQYERASSNARHAVEIKRRLLGNRHLSVARSLNILGVIELRLNRYATASECFEEAVSIRRDILGPTHPYVAGGLINLATIARVQQRQRDGIELLLKAVELFDNTLPPNHRYYGSAYQNLGIQSGDIGEFDDAIDYLRRAIDIFDRSGSPEHLQKAELLGELGWVYHKMGRSSTAARYLTQAKAMAESAGGEQHLPFAIILGRLATVVAIEGREEEAWGYFERALEIVRSSVGPNHPIAAEEMIGMGVLRLKMGRADQAIPLLEDGVAILVERQLDPEKLAEARFALAEALWRTGEQRQRAIQLAEEARRFYQNANPRPFPAVLAKVGAWLGSRQSTPALPGSGKPE